MFGLPPGARQVVVVLQCSENFPYQVSADSFGCQHFLQQLIAMPDFDIEIFGKLVHAEVVGHDDGGTNLTEGQDETIRRRGRRASLRGVADRVGQDMGAEHAGGSFDLYPLFFAKANLSCHAFGIQFCIGEPRIKKLQAGILEDFVFDLFQDGEDVLLLSEFDPQQGADALGQSQICVGIKQR